MKKQKGISRVISYLLVIAMVVTMIPSNVLLVTAKAETAPDLSTMLSDLVEVKLGDETKTMNLINQKSYECKFDGVKETVSDDSVSNDDLSGETAAEEKRAELIINGESVASETVALGKDDVYFRLQDGKFFCNQDDDWTVKSAALVGNFYGLEFVDDNGERYNIDSWNPADANAELDYIGNGFYSRTFKFNELAKDVEIADTGYKVAANDAWNIDWGVGGKNVALTIPAGSTELTVWVDTIQGKVYDSVRSEVKNVASGGNTTTLAPFTDAVSIVGPVRQGKDDWNNTAAGWEMIPVSDSLYVRQETIAKAGGYAWKTVYKNNNWADFDNKNIKLTNDNTTIIFVYDSQKDQIFDSINNASEVGEYFGIAAAAANQEVIHNTNDTFTFVCAPEGEEAPKEVSLVYGVWDGKAVVNPTTISLEGRKDGTFISKDTIYFGDQKQTIAYYYVIDGVDTLDTTTKDKVKDADDKEWSTFEKELFAGRKVSLPGTVNGNSWSPAKESEVLSYEGDGVYSISYDSITAGSYQYKIAIAGSWDENYGASGVEHGDNMNIVVPKTMPVTFKYNDVSHMTVNSVDYIFASITLESDDFESVELTDNALKGIYSADVNLKAGTYKNIKYVYDNVDYTVGDLTLEEDKVVTFYFDPTTDIYYNNASNEKVDKNKIKYDSKDIEYKDPFGAVEQDQNVTFTLETGSDATDAKLIVKGLERKTLKMTEVKAADSVSGNSVSGDSVSSDSVTTKKWTVTTNFANIGEYQYFFVASNGSDIVVYSDDDKMDYGTGVATDLVSAIPYDLIVYQKGFDTPDWMKNAVIYQIFPERFNNGDPSNDLAQQSSRGAVDYEYVKDWSTLPENPSLRDADGNYSDAYKACNAWAGDGQWSDEIYGGDVQGIIDRIDYLKAVGVTVIYLNPVCASISSHRYDTSDYRELDPILGDMGDFEELVKVAKANGMYVVLDGVFNHVSDDSVYFDRYYKYLDAGTDKLGAYPYWAYVYDAMAKDKNLTQAQAEKAAQDYFTKEYGITDYTYTKWFDVYQNSPLLDDDGNETKDTIGHRVGKTVYGYEGWWGYDSMPVIKATNGSEYQTEGWAKEIIGTEESKAADDGSVGKYWLEKGSNGWRLDVANEVSDETWQHFRKSVKALNEDNVIIGEIWTDAVGYLLGDMYDSVMNYMFRGAVLTYVQGGEEKTEAGGSAKKATVILERLRERYPQEAFYAMMNLVGSHDTQRILSCLDGIKKSRADQTGDDALKKAFPTYEGTSDEAKQLQYVVAFIQMTYAGAPTIYYGDEIGMVGADDPDDRRAMAWGEGNKDLVEWYATMAKIRSEYTALRTGSVEMFDVNDAVLAYVRSDKDATLAVMANNSAKDIAAEVNFADLDMADGAYTDLVNKTEYTVANGKATITIPAYRGVVLVTKDSAKEIRIDAENLKPAYDASFKVDNSVKKLAESISISETAKNVKVGETFTLKATTAPANAVDSNGIWTSSDPKVATVGAKGNVTAKKEGTAVITVAIKNGKTAICKVTVAPSKTPDTKPDDSKPADETIKPAEVVKPAAKGTKLATKTSRFVVTSASTKNPTVQFTAPKSKKAATVSIPATVKYKGVTYKVTSIKKNAFKDNKKIKKVTIGKNIKSIGSKAFYNAKNLKTIIVKTTSLKTTKVGSKAFKGVNKNVKVTVPSKKYKSYKKLLKAKGMPKTAKYKKAK